MCLKTDWEVPGLIISTAPGILITTYFLQLSTTWVNWIWTINLPVLPVLRTRLFNEVLAHDVCTTQVGAMIVWFILTCTWPCIRYRSVDSPYESETGVHRYGIIFAMCLRGRGIDPVVMQPPAKNSCLHKWTIGSCVNSRHAPENGELRHCFIFVDTIILLNDFGPSWKMSSNGVSSTIRSLAGPGQPGTTALLSNACYTSLMLTFCWGVLLMGERFYGNEREVSQWTNGPWVNRRIVIFCHLGSKPTFLSLLFDQEVEFMHSW